MKVKVRSKLDDYLSKNGIKKRWLADQIGCGEAHLWRWCKNKENGEALATPSVGYLIRMTQVLDCEVVDLFEVIEESD